jgi:ABC-type nitrate/sulfonate/bicarbonate transport system substrate-binding protein
MKGSPLHRRLGFLATFLLEEKLISEPVDVDDVMDASVMAQALKTRRCGP